MIVTGIRKLLLEDLLSDCVVEASLVEQLRRHVEQTSWTGTPGLMWYNWDEDRVVPVGIPYC